MKNYSSITENKDIITKEYADSNFMPFSGGTFTGDVTFSSGQGHLRTDLIKSADNSKWIAEFTSSGLELGGSGYALRFYSSTRPVVANLGKELAYTSDIPDISGKQDIITESNKLSASLVSGLAQVATTGSYNDLLNKPTIPAAVTSINGLSGGTLTSPLTLTGGDSATASKIILSSNGQITDSGTATMLGFSGGNYIVGSANYPTTFRGKQTRPTWNGKDLALHSDIPAAVTESTVSGWGFTKNTGTVTSVAVKMNGSEKGKVTSSGTIDLGTVLTNASAFATSAQGTKADNAMPKSGGTFTGDISVPKTITFTNTTNPFIKMTTQGVDFYFQSTSGQFGLGPTWNKATHWDSEGNVTFPTVPKVGSSPLALKSDIPNTSNFVQKSAFSLSGTTLTITI